MKSIFKPFDKVDYLIFFLYYSVGIILRAYDYSVNNNPIYITIIDNIAYVLTSFFTILVMFNWIIPLFLKKSGIILGVFLALITVTIFGGIFVFVLFLTDNEPWSEFPKPLHFLYDSITYNAEIVGFPLGLVLTKKFYQSQSEINQLESEKKENELKLLRAQIDPHFLFNNLNTLDSLVLNQPELARNYIQKLSSVYRYLIHTKDSEVMELKEELKFAEDYFYLIQMRYGENYQLEILQKEIDGFLPTGALQSLLENVIKHNPVVNQIQIKTKISIDDDFVLIENNKPTKQNKNNRTTGTGLQNLKTRYELLSNEQVVIDDSDNRFSVKIPILKTV